MSHKRPPADRVPGLRFMAWVVGFMFLVLLIWYGILELVT